MYVCCACGAMDSVQRARRAAGAVRPLSPWTDYLGRKSLQRSALRTRAFGVFGASVWKKGNGNHCTTVEEKNPGREKKIMLFFYAAVNVAAKAANRSRTSPHKLALPQTLQVQYKQRVEHSRWPCTWPSQRQRPTPEAWSCACTPRVLGQDDQGRPVNVLLHQHSPRRRSPCPSPWRR